MVQLLHHGRRRTLLRPEHSCGAFGADERVVHITSNEDFNSLQSRMQTAQVNFLDCEQSCTPVPNRLALAIQKGNTQCLERPNAAIHRGAAADAQQDAVDATIESSRINWPVPKLVVRMGFRRAGGTSAKPEARDISMTAVLPSPVMPYSAVILFPRGPITLAFRIRPPVPEITASSVPSPPSAMGISVTWAFGSPLRTPLAIARAASIAERLSLKALGATRILSGCRRRDMTLIDSVPLAPARDRGEGASTVLASAANIQSYSELSRELLRYPSPSPRWGEGRRCQDLSPQFLMIVVFEDRAYKCKNRSSSS